MCDRELADPIVRQHQLLLLRVSTFGVRIQGFRFRVDGSGMRKEGIGFRISGSGFGFSISSFEFLSFPCFERFSVFGAVLGFGFFGFRVVWGSGSSGSEFRDSGSLIRLSGFGALDVGQRAELRGRSERVKE